MKIKIILTLIVLILVSGCSQVAVTPGEVDNLGNLITADFLYSVDIGDVEGAFTVHKFGGNDAIGTSITPISFSGFYRTPTVAQSLEVLSDSGLDTALGTGGRRITVIGLNNTGYEVQENVTLNGVTPVQLANQYLRVYRWYVIDSGSYATQTIGSHAGTITIRGTGAGDVWSTLALDSGFGVGQSQIGSYTVPKGYSCYLLNKIMSVDSTKTATLYFFKRENILDTTAPYSAMRMVEKHIGVNGVVSIMSESPIAKFPELTDIGFMGKVAVTSAAISVEFELLCLDNTLY